MSTSRAAFLALGLLLAAGQSASLYAAIDMFLKIGDIKGDSTDLAHNREITVLAWSWGMSNPGSLQTGSGGTIGKVSMSNMSITKYVDSSSAPLMKLCATGKMVSNAQLILRTTGDQPLEFYTINMTNVMVVGISSGGSGGEDRLTENLALSFGQVNVVYHPAPEATLEPRIGFDWNITQDAGLAAVIPAPLPAPVPTLVSSLTYTNDTAFAQLTWVSTAGAVYRIWAADSIDSRYQLYGGDIPSAGDGTTSMLVPALFTRKFFRIETVSVK